jgi:HAD superfamily hydrolase (TIGR01490 family)
MATRWAVFDVDGTLLPGTSMERLLIRALVRERLVRFDGLLRFACSAAVDWIRGGVPRLLTNKRYLRGLAGDPVILVAERLVLDEVIPAIPRQARREIGRLRRGGHRLLLLSGSPDFMLPPLAIRLGADAAFGTVLETKNGAFTGRVSGAQLYGPAKTTALLRKKSSLDLDFSRSSVYANDASDADHMRRFGTAVAVNPRRRLRRIAEKAGWRVVQW